MVEHSLPSHARSGKSHPAIELENVNVPETLHHVMLKIEQGDCFGILGPENSGKTALFDILTGKSTQWSGIVRIMGYELPKHERRLRSLCGAVPLHDLNILDEERSAWENLDFHANLITIPRREKNERIALVLESVDMTCYEHLSVRAFPLELKRRLALARALLSDPDILILDEPTSGLETSACKRFWKTLQYVQERGRTIVMMTKNWEEVYAVCNKVAVLSNGAFWHDVTILRGSN